MTCPFLGTDPTSAALGHHISEPCPRLHGQGQLPMRTFGKREVAAGSGEVKWVKWVKRGPSYTLVSRRPPQSSSLGVSNSVPHLGNRKQRSHMLSSAHWSSIFGLAWKCGTPFHPRVRNMFPDEKISFGGIPNSRNVLFLQFFLCNLLRSLLRNLLRNPLNLTWPCTKDSKNLLRDRLCTFSGTCWIWLAFAPRLAGTFSGTFSGTGSAPKPPFSGCWTWLGFAPKPPRPSPEASPEPSPEPCWTWPCSAPKPPRPGTFLGTSLNLTRRLHQCTPELFWAEDPISIRCWGTTKWALPCWENNQ